MGKPWLGYLSAVLLLMAGVFQIMGGNLKIGILFIVLSIASVVIQIWLGKNQGGHDQHS